MTDDASNVTVFALPGFELIEKVGQGGMAEVWKARQVSLDRVVAIKFLQPQLSGNTDEIDRLLTEARAAAKLKHQGIVQVYDAGESNGRYYIVMEFIAGYSVGEWLRRKKIIDERESLLVAECVAVALQYAWTSARIIHCDVKPDNIMVDRDGTIKVADLGLARMVNPRMVRAQVEEIIGTPSYISPEQSQGEVELDCRTDIYALGAMLYHMVTGRRLFEKFPDAEAMDKQITDFEPDPIEFNPHLSSGICWLIEKMLVKNRDGRQADWDAVVRDIQIVQQGRLPLTPRPVEGTSTVKRSRNRPAPPVVVKSRTSAAASFTPPPRKSSGIVTALVFAAVLIVILGLSWWLTSRAKPVVSKTVPMAPAQPPRPVVATATGNLDHARDAFEFVAKWAKEHPGALREAIQRFRKVANETRGTKYSMMAEDEIRRLEHDAQERIEVVMRGIRQSAEAAAGGERFEEAVSLVTDYTGPFAQETQEMRKRLAEDYRRRATQAAAAHAQAAKAVEARYQKLFAEAVGAVGAGQLAQADEMLAKACADPELAARGRALESTRVVVAGAMRINDRIIDSFRQQIGQPIVVNLNQGTVQLVVSGVDQRLVRCNQQLSTGGSMEFEFKLEDLSPQEKIIRMGSDDQPEVALAKGVMAMQVKAYAKAADFFAKVGSGLGPPLVEMARTGELKQADEKAETAAVRLAQSLGIKLGAYEENSWRETLQSAQMPADRRAELARQLKPFEERYGATRIGRSALVLFNSIVAPPAPVQESTPVVAEGNSPQPVSGEGRDPGEPDKIRRALLAKNIGLRDAEISMQPDEAGRVVRVTIYSPAIVDLGPLTGMETVSELAVGGMPPDMEDSRIPYSSLKNLAPLSHMPQLRKLYAGHSMVEDLTPLKGLQLQSLNVRRTRVRDISAIQTMPLEELMVAYTDVRSLAPLRGRTLRLLDISGTKIFDLQPLAGIPLREINAANIPLQNLTPLRDMPLERLNLTGCRAFDFNPLRNMPLRSLELADTQFKDFAILKTMPLTRLWLNKLKIGDLACLNGLRLEELNLQGALFKDLEPLRGMKLRWLVLADTRVRILDPLREMPLDYLNLANTPVSDLSPLKNMQLRALDISGTDVHDIGPITDMPLVNFNFDGDKVRDYAPLRNSSIETMWISGNKWEQHIRKFVRQMPRLRAINGNDIAFWNKRE